MQHLIDPTIEYDKLGRMKYHPLYHPNSGKPWTQEELIYLCKFWEYDSNRDMSFALGRNETSCASKVTHLKKNGAYWRYKNYEGEW